MICLFANVAKLSRRVPRSLRFFRKGRVIAKSKSADRSVCPTHAGCRSRFSSALTATLGAGPPLRGFGKGVGGLAQGLAPRFASALWTLTWEPLTPPLFLDPARQYRYDINNPVSYLRMAAGRSLFDNLDGGGLEPFHPKTGTPTAISNA